MMQHRTLLAGLAALLALLIAADLLVEHHPHFGIDGTPGFAAWFGFGAAALALVLATGWGVVAKARRPRDDD